jgi:hypothetical protein
MEANTDPDTDPDPMVRLNTDPIRIRNPDRINVFFGLPDPDPLVRGMDPDPALDPDPSIIMQKIRKTLNPTIL